MTDLPLPAHPANGKPLLMVFSEPTKANFSLDELRAYALAERLAERARCAAICENMEFVGAAYYGAGPRTGSLECAEAIRAQP